MRNLQIAELIFNRPLMISEAKLNVILHILGPRLNLDLSGTPREEAAALADSDRARAGYRVQDGIAVIGIHGPLMNRVLASQFPSGGPTTYADIRSSFDTALADDGVQEIKLDIDSPGGDVSGAFDLADHIYESRGLKPITAVVNESAFSAGYLLASAAGKIVVPRTANVGSIGVIMTHADFSRAEDQNGITVTHIFAGAKKADFSPHRPLSDAAMADADAMVNSTYDLFVATIARNRGLSEADVRATEAGMFRGPKAVQIGLADEVMPAAKAAAKRHTMKDMPMGPMSPNQTAPGGKTSAEIPQGGNKRMTKAELNEQHPALYAEIFGEGKQVGIAEATAAERSRVTAIMGIPGPAAQAHKALLLEGIETGKSAGDVSLAIQHKEADLLTNAGKGIKEGAVNPAPAVDPGSHTAPEAAQEAAVGDAMAQAAEAWQKRN